MEKFQFKENPEFLKKLIEFLEKFLPEELNAADATQRLRLEWNWFRREAEYFLNQLLSDPSLELSPIEEHYWRKIRFLRRERKWLRTSQKLLPKKIKVEREYAGSLENLAYTSGDRRHDVQKVVFPDWPDTRIRLPPEVEALLAKVHNEYLRTQKAFDGMIRRAVNRIISSYTRRQWSRWLYWIGLERFWGFVVLTLILEQIIQNWLESHIPTSIGHYWKIGLFLILLLIAYEVKEHWLNPPIKKFMEKLRKTQLWYNIGDAAEAQTRIESMYIIIDSYKKWDESIRRSSEKPQDQDS